MGGIRMTGPVTHPKKQIQGVLDGAKRQCLLSSRQVDGQVIELFSLVHHLATAATQQRGNQTPFTFIESFE